MPEQKGILMNPSDESVNIAQIMIPKISTAVLHENDSVRQGIEVFKRYGYTAVPVVNSEEKYVGCVSEGDFLRLLLKIRPVYFFYFILFLFLNINSTYF